jgi:hypothetical protein
MLEVEVAGNDVILWCVRKSDGRSAKMGTTYVGAHMLVADNHADLLKLIGRDLIAAITKARDVGYAHAQADIRKALGV